MSEINTEKTEKFEFSSALWTPSGIAMDDEIDRNTSSKWVNWGRKNLLPKILFDNYLKNSQLQAIINSMTDYVMGEGVTSDYIFNEELDEEIRKAVFDYILFGGFALEGIRNAKGDLVVLRHINIMNVRVNEELTTAYLSPKWQTYSGKEIIEMPLYNKDEKQPHFILFYRGTITRGINPIPCYISALKSIEILNNTREFHLKNLENGFSASVLVSFNNGTMKQRDLQEIKEKMEVNYQGAVNAGKVIFVNSQDKEHSPTIERLNADNFGEQYFALQDSSSNDLYTAFRINPVLLGINVPSGFQAIEYENIFKLYHRTVILPLQKNIKKVFKSLGIELEFSEFKINWEE